MESNLFNDIVSAITPLSGAILIILVLALKTILGALNYYLHLDKTFSWERLIQKTAQNVLKYGILGEFAFLTWLILKHFGNGDVQIIYGLGQLSIGLVVYQVLRKVVTSVNKKAQEFNLDLKQLDNDQLRNFLDNAHMELIKRDEFVNENTGLRIDELDDLDDESVKNGV